MDTEQLCQAAQQALKQMPDLVAAYVFGSRARGSERQSSDLDLALLFATDLPSTLASSAPGVASDLELALGARVDVVLLNRAPADLVHRVLRDGRLLVDRDPSARLRFEVRARSEYLDLLPVLRRYRQGYARPRPHRQGRS